MLFRSLPKPCLNLRWLQALIILPGLRHHAASKPQILDAPVWRIGSGRGVSRTIDHVPQIPSDSLNGSRRRRFVLHFGDPSSCVQAAYDHILEQFALDLLIGAHENSEWSNGKLVIDANHGPIHLLQAASMP